MSVIPPSDASDRRARRRAALLRRRITSASTPFPQSFGRAGQYYTGSFMSSSADKRNI
jgi:hypothetical protein